MKDLLALIMASIKEFCRKLENIYQWNFKNIKWNCIKKRFKKYFNSDMQLTSDEKNQNQSFKVTRR